MTDTRLPVVVLSGFLGAGKTTMLTHLLHADHGRRLAVIVNDMSELNVDAALIAGGTDIGRGEERLVEMSNGCICCTLREDLLVEVRALAATGRFDGLVIESSGISEPMPVAATFSFVEEDGSCLADEARLDQMVTVVDAAAFLRDWYSHDDLADRDMAAAPEDQRSIVDLLVEQVEFADTLVLNKTDQVDAAGLDRLEAILRRLNTTARVVRAERGVVEPAVLLEHHVFDDEQAASAPGWLAELEGRHLPETEVFGIGSFVWRPDRPVHPARWDAAARRSWPGVLRSKGFLWFASRHDVQVVWSQAGVSATLEPAAFWLDALLCAQAELDEGDLEIAEAMRADGLWHPLWGDRRTELVVIGVSLDEAALTTVLDATQVTEAELLSGPRLWSTWPDTFGESLPRTIAPTATSTTPPTPPTLAHAGHSHG